MEIENQPEDSLARGRRSLIFVGVLGLVLATMGAVVVEHAYPPGSLPLGADGEIRPVPTELLRSQIRSGRISDREADHWRVKGEEGAP